MGPLDLLLHLLNFAAPALFVAALLQLFSRFFMRKEPKAPVWWVQIAINFVAGCAVLLAGLGWLGSDGKMVTYAALVVVCAVSQWLLLRAWKK